MSGSGADNGVDYCLFNDLRFFVCVLDLILCVLCVYFDFLYLNLCDTAVRPLVFCVYLGFCVCYVF